MADVLQAESLEASLTVGQRDPDGFRLTISSTHPA